MPYSQIDAGLQAYELITGVDNIIVASYYTYCFQLLIVLIVVNLKDQPQICVSQQNAGI